MCIFISAVAQVEDPTITMGRGGGHQTLTERTNTIGEIWCLENSDDEKPPNVSDKE